MSTSNSHLDYELLDLGNKSKLERFGDRVIARPCIQATQAPSNLKAWESVNTSFEKPHKWAISYQPPNSRKLTIQLETNPSSQQVGIFPEHEPIWNWLHADLLKKPNARVLNLFGYTGVASLVAALAGANVEHVDSSKHALTLGKESESKSSLESHKISWICEDVMTYLKRVEKRGVSYDLILLDPPAFGRAGSKTFQFKKEYKLLIQKSFTALAPRGKMIFTHYASTSSDRSVKAELKNFFKEKNINEQPLKLQAAAGPTLFCATTFICIKKLN